jgi:hypothetical protein
MKRFFILSVVSLILGISVLQAQNPRILILECFTESGCGPCASQNPAIDALLEANQDVMVAVKYHVEWPSGTDPMYHHNPSDNGARTNYYGVNAVPYEVLCGNLVNGSMPTQAQINNYSAQEAPVDLRVSFELNAAEDSIFVNVMGKALSPISGNLKLQVAVIEKLVQFPSAPGPNGERTFRNVMKKMLPSATGSALPSELFADDYFAYSFSWALANVYDKSQLSVVAWVQNNDDKTIYQACSVKETFTPFYTVEASLNNILHAKSLVCSGSMNPDFELTNFGSQAITSAVIEAVVNGEVVKTYEWTGILPSLKKTTVNMGEILFSVQDENDLTFRIVSLNGAADEFAGNDSVSYAFEGSPLNSGKAIKLTIRTDNDPQETTWQLKSMTTGEVVLSGGPYTEANTMSTETLDIPGDDCYEFTIYDAGGNGLKNVNGLYGMKAGGTTLFSGADFGDRESNEFSYEKSVGIEEPAEDQVQIYPNPANDKLFVDAENANYQIISITGAVVKSGIVRNASIDVTDLSEGLYMVKVAEMVQKIMIVR